MNKINFQDLPNETTPINANNLNQLQTNVDNAKLDKSGGDITGNISWQSSRVNNVDANNYDKTGTWFLGTGCSNVPANYIRLLTLGAAGMDVAQLGLGLQHGGELFYRVKASNEWRDWFSILPVTITNSNGTATKFPDGTMICTNRINIANVSITVADGNIYRSGVLDEFPNFPAGFIDNPSLEISYLSSEDTKPAWAVKANAATTSAPRGFYLYSGASRTLTNAKVCYIAVGRWK